MLSAAPAPAIFLHTDATDMRKSVTGLCGLVRSVFNDDPADGSLFLFVNKRRDRIKAVWWDGDGFVLWYKRLEQGTFEIAPASVNEKRVQIDATQLAMILGGVRLETARRRKRFSRAS
jgi:transposase